MKKDEKLNRRGFIQKSLILSAGTTAILGQEEKILLAKRSKKPGKSEIKVPSGMKVPEGKIGSRKITRLICGGNLIGGWAHSRDLIYVSQLFKNYFTDDKIIETLEISESNGINTIVTVVDERTFTLLNKHRKNGGKIQWIAQIRVGKIHTEEAQIAVDNGAIGGFLHGGIADRFVKKPESIKKIADIVDLLKKNKCIAGVGAHKLATTMACEENKLNTYFYMKTLNTADYFCDNPDEVIKYMQSLKKPWIAYKVLGAGVVNPTKGFKYAFQKGADFACVGMFDFQVSDDATILKGIFARGINRERPWMG